MHSISNVECGSTEICLPDLFRMAGDGRSGLSDSLLVLTLDKTESKEDSVLPVFRCRNLVPQPFSITSDSSEEELVIELSMVSCFSSIWCLDESTRREKAVGETKSLLLPC